MKAPSPPAIKIAVLAVQRQGYHRAPLDSLSLGLHAGLAS